MADTTTTSGDLDDYMRRECRNPYFRCGALRASLAFALDHLKQAAADGADVRPYVIKNIEDMLDYTKEPASA